MDLSCFILLLLSLSCILSSPVGKRKIKVVNEDLLPPDHIHGAPFEQDGDVNMQYHHEVFLGNLIANGTLERAFIEGYKKLIEIFHKVDWNGNHQIENDELVMWIHTRILEHYAKATKDSLELFKKVNYNHKSAISWPEYKAMLLGKDPQLFENITEISADDKNGEFSTQVAHWISADYDNNGLLNEVEFLSFVHPEHNKKTLRSMAEEMMQAFDKNKDKKLEVEEFAALPPGEVDPDEAQYDIEYQQEQREHFKNMDDNKDNIVSIDELELYLDPRNKQHAQKEAEFLLRNSDKNRDGKINEHEMLLNHKLFTGSKFSSIAHLLHDEF